MSMPGGAEGIDQRKRALRAHFRQLRRELAPDLRREADARIEERLAILPAFAQADVVLTYLDMGSEVRTHGIIEHAWAVGKIVALPRCVPGTHEMAWYCVESFGGLVRSRFGVEEPDPVQARQLVLDGGKRAVALVPGLTFDERGYRLGYGGGFYDRFLADFDGVSVGLCREVQMSDDLRAAGVVDAFDLPVQLVATEARTIG